MRGHRPQRSGTERAIQSNAVDLLSYLRRRVGNDEAADLLGETFAIAWRREGDTPSDHEQARMWLFGVARGVVLNHQRGERRRWALAQRIQTTVAAPDTQPAADQHLDVRDAIARLDPDLAELVRLVHWDGMTLTEAAQIMGIPASTARGRYQRAKQDLRAALEVSVPS